MTDLTPEKLEHIVKALATLRRAASLEADGESTIVGQQMLAAAFVVGGSNLMLMQSVREITNELRDLMHSNDGRLNQLHNALLDFVRAIEQGVRLSDSNAEALLMRLNGLAEQIGEAVPELAGAIESVGTDIGAGLAEGLKVACKGRACRRGT